MSTKSNNKKFKIFFVVTVLLFSIILVSIYITKENFRNWIDINILRKDINEEDIISIDLDSEKSNQVFIYNKYIAILNNQIIKLYNKFGEEITEINVGINKPLFDANEKYLVIAEQGGGEICLILDKTYLWSNKIEGEILQIHVNRNGYVAVVTEDSTYKSILSVYNSDGVKLFNSYYSDTRIVDVSISRDNKYVAMAEIDVSGILIKSNVRVISVEDAKNGNKNANLYTYNVEDGKLLTRIKYQSKNQIACMYDDSIHIIQNNEGKEIVNIKDKQITYMSVGLDNNIVYIEEETKGVFKTNSHINILNTHDGKFNTYSIEEVVKGLYTSDNIIAVNVGTELYFLNTSGWLVKKYSTKQEISNVMFSKHIAGIIYKDKIIILDL